MICTFLVLIHHQLVDKLHYTRTSYINVAPALELPQGGELHGFLARFRRTRRDMMRRSLHVERF